MKSQRHGIASDLQRLTAQEMSSAPQLIVVRKALFHQRFDLIRRHSLELGVVSVTKANEFHSFLLKVSGSFRSHPLVERGRSKSTSGHEIFICPIRADVSPSIGVPVPAWQARAPIHTLQRLQALCRVS